MAFVAKRKRRTILQQLLNERKYSVRLCWLLFLKMTSSISCISDLSSWRRADKLPAAAEDVDGSAMITERGTCTAQAIS